MSILVTGSTGYIGSHTCIELAKAGFNLVGIDNLSNSNFNVHGRVESIIGRSFPFYEVDVLDERKLQSLFKDHKFDAVLHFAGLKSVSESVEKSLMYYKNNVVGSLVLLNCMKDHGVRHLVFSSSATVYGESESIPIKESAPLKSNNPYGASKLMVENILRDHSNSQNLAGEPWSIAILRYFNPVGAHDSGRIGEQPNGVPNNLMPYVAQVAIGHRERLNVFGNDYPTHDGTGVRDYIHVVDLARGHVRALERLFCTRDTFEVNLGTGIGYSVLDVVRAFEKVSGTTVKYQITRRRPGDVATSYSDPTLAAEILGWRAELSLEDMCASTWKWQVQNPNGY